MANLLNRRNLMCDSLSPYKASATKVLKETFPSYWGLIRDYGWENLPLVPFIDSDPMVICSLLHELRWERVMEGDGHSYVDLGLNPRYFEAWGHIKLLSLKTWDNKNAIPFGFGFSPYFCRIIIISDAFWLTCGEPLYDEFAFPAQINTWYDINLKIAQNYQFISSGDSIFVQNKSVSYIGSNYAIFAEMTDPGYVGENRITYMALRDWNIKADGITHKFVPCIYNGIGGLLNTTMAEFRPNLGTGSFSFSQRPL